jgi:transcriptional regulator with XRE-family HTH domain
MLRRSRGLTQVALARALGLSPAQIEKYEKGVNRIGAGRLYQIAQLLEVPVGHLFDSGAAADLETTEMAAQPLQDLNAAFLSIAKEGIREALLALVCVIAITGHEQGLDGRSVRQASR